MSTICEDVAGVVSDLPQRQSTTSRSTSAGRVLLISCHFPPVGGAGVQRPLKFVKYLPQFGWEVSVLCATNPSVPTFDETLCAEIPEQTILRGARTWEPSYQSKQRVAGNDDSTQAASWPRRLKTAAITPVKSVVRSGAISLLQPEPQVLWLPNAVREGLRLLKEEQHDVILATAPPYTNLIVGAILKKMTGLPLVLDFRDEWDLSARYLENRQRDRWAAFVQRKLQRYVLRSADGLIATTEASANRIQSRSSEAGRAVPSTCIYNGFDDTDLPGAPSASRTATDRLRLVYTGTLWNLTTIQPLVDAIIATEKTNPDITSRLELVCVGRKTVEQQQILDRVTSTSCRLVDESYCDHGTALEWMSSADVLCLLLTATEGADRVVPGKLFEYLAMRRPMLSITPPGETADLVRRFQPDACFSPENIAGISRWLTAKVEEHTSGGTPVSMCSSPSDSIDQFSRRALTGELADFLSQIRDTEKRRA